MPETPYTPTPQKPPVRPCLAGAPLHDVDGRLRRVHPQLPTFQAGTGFQPPPFPAVGIGTSVSLSPHLQNGDSNARSGNDLADPNM